MLWRLLHFLTLTQLLRVWWAYRQTARFEPVLAVNEIEPERRYASVSVVIPARNEAFNIVACLEGVRVQTYPEMEVVVVDDRSEDETAAQVEAAARVDGRIRLVHGEPLPDGWIGKCWALHQGAGAARGEWLLFVDADTRLLPGAVAGAVLKAERRGAQVFSALTHQQLPTVWERIAMPAVFGALAEALPIEFVNDPRLPQFALANGQFLLVRRDTYERMGGHAAIKDEIGEDARLAQRAKRLGVPFWLGDGRTLATTRMYTTPGGLWEGWTKNLHVGIRLIPWVVPPGLVIFVATLVSPYLLIARGARRGSRADLLSGLTQLGASLWLRRGLDRIYDVPAVYTLAQPLGQLVFLTLLASSFYNVLTGQGVTWKGRRYYAAP